MPTKNGGNRIAPYTRQTEEFESACQDIIIVSPALKQRFDILLSIPAVGTITAFTLLTEMTELSALSDKQAASLAGLMPIARDSGAFRGKRYIRCGRAQVRQALYMAALAAVRFNKDIKKRHQGLIDVGKPPKAALTAIIVNAGVKVHRRPE